MCRRLLKWATRRYAGLVYLLVAHLGVHGAWVGKTLAGGRWEELWEPPSLQYGFVASAVYDSTIRTLYFADRDSSRVRSVRLSPPGPVATVAGAQRGHADGSGATAAFDAPAGLALAGLQLVVTDSGNHCIRMISLSRDDHPVTTLAGRPGLIGMQDGIGTAASFQHPMGVAMDPGGTRLVVADTGNHRLRIVDLADGAVNTLAGSVEGFADGDASRARFSSPLSIAAIRDTSMFANFLLVVADGGAGKLRAVDFKRRIVVTLSLPDLSLPSCLAASSNGRRLAVLNHSRLLLVNVDAASREAAVDEIPLGWQLHNGTTPSSGSLTPQRAGGFAVDGENGEELSIFVADSRQMVGIFRKLSIDGSTPVQATCAKGQTCGCALGNCSCGSFYSPKCKDFCCTCPRGAICDCFSACNGVPKPCREGTFNLRPGASSPDECGVCPAGHICAMGTDFPVPCPTAHYCPAATQRDCVVDSFPCRVPCPPGTQGNSTGHAEEKEACTECGQGLFGASPGAVACTPCPSGTYSSERGSTVCADCPAGYYCSMRSKAPHPCPINTYSSRLRAQDSSTCLPCKKGSLTEKEASPSEAFCNITVATPQPVATTILTSSPVTSTAPAVETPAPVGVAAQPIKQEVILVQAQANLGGIGGQDVFLSCCAPAFLRILRDMLEPHVVSIRIFELCDSADGCRIFFVTVFLYSLILAFSLYSLINRFVIIHTF
jgi:hypothetical protein